MASWKTSLLAAGAAVIVTAAGLHLVERNRAMEAAQLRAANGRLRAEASQRRQAQIAAAVPAAARETSAAATVAMRGAAAAAIAAIAEPAGDYRDEGQATPLATLQTFAWACDRGDSERVASLLCFEGAGRAKAVAFMATLPASARAQWTSPEAMAGALLTANTMKQPFPRAELLERATPEVLGDGRVMLRLPQTPKDRTQYQKFGDKWHYVITEAEVDAYIARAAAR